MYKHFFKRFFDFCIALVALLLIGWFLIIVAIWLHFANKGAGAFFLQERPGKDAKIFRVIKFKTMTDERDAEGNLLPDAQRLTKIGRLVRSLSIDELPQLINILLGQMSIVGPRPERPEIAKEYEKELPEFALRLQVRAGLTGYAQVYGKYNTIPYDKLMMDLMYIAHANVFEDIRIIFATIKILFLPESTEGIEAGEVTALKNEVKNK